MVWANGKQNLGLVNFVQESVNKRPRRPETGITKTALKKWNTNFRLEYSVRKIGLPFQMFNCSRELSAGKTKKVCSISATFQPDFPKTSCK